MVVRDSNGRFGKGHQGGPGRPKREKEAQYLQMLTDTVTPEKWQAIVNKAYEQAAEGDQAARRWLSDYLLGPPQQDFVGDVRIVWDAPRPTDSAS